MKNILVQKFQNGVCGICLSLLLIVSSGSGCKSEKNPQSDTKKLGAPPPPEKVVTVFAVQKSVVDHRVFTGRTVAAQSVEIRARVSGTIVQSLYRYSDKVEKNPGKVDDSPGVHVDSKWYSYLNSLPKDDESNFMVTAKEGDEVSKGTPLFQIDPRPFRTALDQAKGNLKALEAQRNRFREERVRVESLLATKSISDTEYEFAKANYEEALGQIATLTASVERANLELASTKIVSPIDGVVGRSLITEGNLVSANSAVLTTVVSRAPVHVYFDIDESSFLKYRELIQQGNLARNKQNRIKVSMALINDSGFPYLGGIDFQDNTTNPNSGNTLLRAEFSNEAGTLSPGLYCRVRVPYSARYDAILIPTKCLGTNQKGRYVMVVNSTNDIEERTVVLGTTHGMYTAITAGLEKGEQVVYEGLQKIRPKSSVDPTESMEQPAFEVELEGNES